MNLKSDEAIAAAMSKTYKGLTKERKEALLATVRAARPEHHEALHANFSEGLTEPEKHFYNDIIENVTQVVNGKPGPDVHAVTGPSTPHARDAHAAT